MLKHRSHPANRATIAIIGLHEFLGRELEHIADEIDVHRIFGELGKCDTSLGNRGFLSFRKFLCKTTFAESHYGRSLAYEGRPFHTPRAGTQSTG